MKPAASAPKGFSEWLTASSGAKDQDTALQHGNALASLLDGPGSSAESQWPSHELALCGRLGVHRWFLSEEQGGFGWPQEEILHGYRWLAGHSLKTALILTQRVAAMKRIAQGAIDELTQWLPHLADGSVFATVGISHLTTSRQHLPRPALSAIQATNDLWRLHGFCPWVTGPHHAQILVVGASDPSGQSHFFAIPLPHSHIACHAPESLLALQGSHTGKVELNDATIPDTYRLRLPPSSDNSAGNLSTSVLALGLADQACRYLREASSERPNLADSALHFQQQIDQLHVQLVAVAQGSPPDATPWTLRSRANELVLRVTQAALIAAKGEGFLAHHPANRWTREAMFFLVWSCPAPVAQSHLDYWSASCSDS
jgi:alkylation response protein AidB-like acyl-CoA dehydrogenase